MELCTEEKFQQIYPGKYPVHRTFCPYRVCPLGAHSDHQHGLISGFAIDKGIEIYFAPSEDGQVQISSMNFPDPVTFHLRDARHKKNDWANYLRGAAVALIDKYQIETGICAVIHGQLPIGGLSSSAAVIIAFLSALCKVNGLSLDKQEIIETAFWAENQFVGVNCGKLDQSCEVLCKKDNLLYLDTMDGTYSYIPANTEMQDYEIAIFFSGVQRSLVGSAFNMRVDECRAAAYALQAFSGMDYGKIEESFLRDVPREVFEKYMDTLPDNWRKRATHFYTEFARVQQGVARWEKGDITGFGKLIFESGRSSIENYETGGEELKAIYEIMLETDGIYGGRFSGAGFKGCCMAMIDPAFKDTITKTVTEKYLKRFPHLADTFLVDYCKTADGCRF